MTPIEQPHAMTEFLDTQPDSNVQEVEYNRLLGFPSGFVFDGRVRELADWARSWFAEYGKPWIYARPAGFQLANDRLKINGSILDSKRLHDQLLDAQAHEAMLVVVSAGKECEERARQLWQDGKPDEYFFLEVFGSAVVEHLVATAGARICAWAEQNGMAVLPHYSPGYSGWDVSDQISLFDLIQQNQGQPFPQDIRVFDSGMLQPKKSLLAVFGYTRCLDKLRSLPKLVPCENCSFSPCQYRRTPYRHSLPQIEDVSRFQSALLPHASSNGSGTGGLNRNAAYSINSRALRKWSHDRLHLRILEDQSVEAQFRYEGTTCSNLGRPIEFDYLVKLTPRDQGYRVVDAVCGPAPTDIGYQHMCEYITDPERLAAGIAREKPLLGKTLDEVLLWKRPYSPAGCYCDRDSRNHKWGLVLEVIHYALVQFEKQTTNGFLDSSPSPRLATPNSNGSGGCAPR
jgi:hypothetical protein